jgi:hypothetical protein
MASRRRSAAYETALRIAKSPRLAPIELAEAIWKAEKQEPGSLKKLVNDTGISLRKGYYLLEIWDKFAHLGVKSSLLADVGWTKLAIVAKHLKPGVELEYLELAHGATAKELPAILEGGSRVLPKARTVQLRLTPTQYRAFQSVLLRAGAKPAKHGRGLINQERAIMRIVHKLQAAG